jgi:hypothetical protein
MSIEQKPRRFRRGFLFSGKRPEVSDKGKGE